jgi:hypothetical protein
MHPDARELLGPLLGVDLLVEEVGDGFIIKGDVRPRADLLDELNVLNQKQIIAGRDAESANFRVTKVTQK